MKYISSYKLNKLPLIDGKNKGFYGICYKYKDDLVLKLFYTNLFKKNKEKIIDNVKKLLGIEIEDVSFPQKIVKVSNYEFSYLMPYISGVSWHSILADLLDDDFDLSFEDIYKCYHDAVLKVEEITNYNIKIIDLNTSNCTYKDDSTFGIFDIDLYERESYFTKNDLLNNNLEELNDMFKTFFEHLYFKYLLNNENVELQDFTNIFYKTNIKSKCFVDYVLEDYNKNMSVNSLSELILKK